jgi:putative two-component system response regulator
MGADPAATTILVVDDLRENLDYLEHLLTSRGYRVLTATGGAAALDLASAHHPDLILCDLVMPLMDGFEFVHRLRHTEPIADTTVIFCTATYLEADARNLARSCGVSILLPKPFEPGAALAAVETALNQESQFVTVPSEFPELRASVVSAKLVQKVEELKCANAQLERLLAKVQRANAELERAYDATLLGWGRALDMRDHETEGHSQRVTEWTVCLARRMGMGEAQLKRIRWGALLHDIGKLAVPDRILLKAGPLDADEWVLMRRHPEHARRLLEPIEFLREAMEIPLHHHERWNGSGYPYGLRGNAIPVSARIFGIVDAWDALRSDRPYRGAWSDSRVRDYLTTESGREFDPAVVPEFLALLDESFGTTNGGTS